MSDRPHASSLRSDFAFQSSEQADGASQQLPQQSYGHYEAERHANAPGASATPLQVPGSDPSMRYQDFGNHNSQQLAGQFQGFGFNPSGPMSWDWTSSLDFTDFTNHYEPQGELVNELQNQNVTTNDFSIPLPITTADGAFQPAQQPQAALPVPANVHTPLSPPPKPPQRPVVQTGMKRKAESEPGSATSQNNNFPTEAHPNVTKRQTKSRQSSETSLTSPVIAPSTEARQSPMAQTVVAQEPSEPTPKTNTEVEKKKEQSKGTGPQGRVIDVSKPRRVAESPGAADMLPAGKVFPIQIGSELFRLSGASISSDGKHHQIIFRSLKNSQLRLLEHPHISRTFSATNCITMAVALVT